MSRSKLLVSSSKLYQVCFKVDFHLYLRIVHNSHVFTGNSIFNTEYHLSFKFINHFQLGIGDVFNAWSIHNSDRVVLSSHYWLKIDLQYEWLLLRDLISQNNIGLLGIKFRWHKSYLIRVIASLNHLQIFSLYEQRNSGLVT